MREGVEADRAPRARHLPLQLVQELFFLREAVARGCLEPGVDGDAAPLLVDDRGEHVPRAEGGHAPLKAWLLVRVFQHGHVRVGALVVAVDARIVGLPGEELVVAGVGEPMPVREVDGAVGVAVTVELALAGDRVPEERHERLAAGDGVGLPEPFAHSLDVRHVALVVEEERVGAGEELLPAEPVEGDEEDVFGLLRLGRQGEAEEGDCKQASDHAARLFFLATKTQRHEALPVPIGRLGLTTDVRPTRSAAT